MKGYISTSSTVDYLDKTNTKIFTVRELLVSAEVSQYYKDLDQTIMICREKLLEYLKRLEEEYESQQDPQEKFLQTMHGRKLFNQTVIEIRELIAYSRLKEVGGE